MKRFWNGKMRLLSLLLSLVLAVGLIPTICINANAVSHGHISVNPTLGATAFHEDGSLKSVQITVTFPSNSYGTAYGKIALHNGEPQHDSSSRYTDEYSDWPTDYSRDSTFIAIDTEAEFQWTGNASNKTWTRTLTFSQGQVPQDTYSLYMWTRCPTAGSSRGVYADAFLTNVTVGNNNVSLGSGSTQHTHTWPAVTPTGNGTNMSTVTIKCDTCHETLTVSLKASDVTLPGNVFNAQIEKTPGAATTLAAQVATNPLKVSTTPGYQYSPNGSGFTPINDPNSFTPKQGIYQASIRVYDDANLDVNLFVKYTVSDPVVTAATGDNRPIELMAAGLVVFSAMAAAAFVLDSKRRTIR